MSKRSSSFLVLIRPPGFRRFLGFLVTFDVDAPVRALPCTQHADGASLRIKGDHAACARNRNLLLLGVHRDGGLLDHGPERQAHSLEQSKEREGDVSRHQNTTLKIEIKAMLNNANGISQRQAIHWS